MNSSSKNQNPSDSELTARAISGHRDAFACIVTRYQSLVCSLAYSATGSISQSEDLAQETFIAAWKNLASLRQPEKLRSWLCGIARNVIAASLRQTRQQPAQVADALDDLPSPEQLPLDHAISNEEESILWRSLEHIPPMYREALVLFYREGQSVEEVAAALDLSADAVKQRLSRGRNLLRLEVIQFVESALSQSRPGRNFTAAVLAGLPNISASAGTAATGSLLLKASTAITKSGPLLAGLCIPVLSAFSSVLYTVGLVKSAHPGREKSLTKAWALAFFITGILIVAVPGTIFYLSDNDSYPAIAIAAGILLLYVECLVFAYLRRKVRIQDGRARAARSDSLPFYGSDSPGFRWNVFGGLMGMIFCSPVGFLAITAALARDTLALVSILSCLTVAYILCCRIVLNSPEKSLAVNCSIMTALFPILLALLAWRWDKWTGHSPWRLHSDPGILIGVSAFVFLCGAAGWIYRRTRPLTR